MKRFHILLIGLVIAGAVIAVGYSDSHVIKKETVQVIDQKTPVQTAVAIHRAVDLSAELPVALVVYSPDLGRPATNYTWVSEKLADGLFMRVRPPPEKVQKSDYTNFT